MKSKQLAGEQSWKGMNDMQERMTLEEFKKIRKKRRSKYGNKKIEVDGYKFDSKAEAKYYQQLKWLQEHGEIKSFKLQPRYILQEAFEKDGKKHRAIEYVADFEVHYSNGDIVVVDVKGHETQVFKIKRKLFEKKYPYKLVLVKLEKGVFVEI